MKATTVLLLAIVLAYLAFEVHVVSRNAYRTEPAFIFGEFITASRAVSRCGPLKPVDEERFEANYRYAKWRAASALAEASSAEPAVAVEARLRAQESEGRRQVDEQVAELGCEDIELFKLRKRYENLARLRLRIPDAERRD